MRSFNRSSELLIQSAATVASTSEEMFQCRLFLALTILIHISTIGYSLKRTVVFHGFSNCANDEKNLLHFNGTVKDVARNKYELNGDVKIDERVTAPLEFQATAKRCNLERSQCENFNTFILPDMCKIFNQKNQIWTDLMAHAQPKPQCPMNPTIIKYRNATIDYSLITHLPLEGFTWIAELKIFKPISNVRHKKRLWFCLLIEASVMNERQNEKKKAETRTESSNRSKV